MKNMFTSLIPPNQPLTFRFPYVRRPRQSAPPTTTKTESAPDKKCAWTRRSCFALSTGTEASMAPGRCDGAAPALAALRCEPTTARGPQPTTGRTSRGAPTRAGATRLQLASLLYITGRYVECCCCAAAVVSHLVFGIYMKVKNNSSLCTWHNR